MKRKPTDHEVDAALLAYWKRDNPTGVDENHGNNIARVRVLMDRVWRKVRDVTLAVRSNDVKMMRRALERQIDRKYSHVEVGEVLEDVRDIVEAVEMGKRRKRRK